MDIINKYSGYEDVWEQFSWSEAWDLVDGTSDAVNATHECVDRHDGEAYRLRRHDGSTATYTFEELSRKASQFANLLDDFGLVTGDAVAIMLNPSLEYLVSFFGALKFGAAAIPCSELFGPQALEYRLDDSDAAVLVTTEETADSINRSLVDHVVEKESMDELIEEHTERHEPTTAGGDVAWIQYTSGTTGHPTGVPYDHQSIVLFAPIMDLMLDLQPGDSCFTTATPGWGPGVWMGLLGTLIYGLPTGHFSGPFDPDSFLDALTEFEVNTLVGTAPTALRRLVDAAPERETIPELEKIQFTGEPMDARLSREVVDTFGAFPRSAYGAVELRSIVTMDFAFPDYEFKHGSMGKPVPGIEARIEDDETGEILPAGEVGRISFRRSDKWVLTEDSGYHDEDGYFFSAGRADDIIISAGYTIGPPEVEEALRSHPAVEEAGVIGVPDDERGEIVKAFVQATEEPTETLKGKIRNFVRSELSKHEYPREIEFIDEVPLSGGGKVKRPELREREGLT